MRLSSRLLCLGFAAMSALLIARADDVAPTAQNRLWQTTPHPIGGTETAGQFGGFSTVTSSAETPGTTPATLPPPTSGDLRLGFSYLGSSFAGAPPDFAIGDTIGMPLATFTDAQNRAVALRREPVHKTDAAFKYRLAGSATILDFNPATAILSERFFWSPHASFTTVPDLSGIYERVTVPGEAGDLRNGFAYASQAGGMRIFWRTQAAIGVDGSNNPVYGLVERAITVSSSSRLPVRRFFWTETGAGFNGPLVTLPADVKKVNFAYTDTFPIAVSTQDSVDPQTTKEVRTFWSEFGKLHALNLQGRVMIELLGEDRGGGLKRQIGIEIVDVVREATPALVEMPLGERLYPLPPEEASKQAYPVPANANARTEALNLISTQLALYNPALVINLNAPDVSFTGQFTVQGQTAYYAQKVTTSAADVQIYWMETGLDTIQWPKFLNRYHQYWPQALSDYAMNVRPSDPAQVGGTLPIFGDLSVPQLIYQDDPTNAQATMVDGTKFKVTLDASDSVNRSLLLFRSGNDFWFVRVESVLDSSLSDARYADYYSGAATASVGERLLPPAGAASVAGYVDLTKGDAIDPTAYIDPFAAGIPAAELGAIIPVNAAPRNANKDKLGVWWFKKISPPANLAGKIDPIYWPSYFTRYTIAWPANAPQIVLASNKGSGALDADVASGSIYYQNNPSLAGYNPNEEHAQMITGTAFALRDDLNTDAITSKPYVLVRYTSADDSRPAMKTFRVLRENETYHFIYPAKAGTVLQAPLPLAVMPPPVRPTTKLSANTEVTPANLDPAPDLTARNEFGYYNSFTFEDRNGLKYVYRGQHNPDGSQPALGMKFYYATRESFAYPNATTGVDEAPAVGTITPFLADILEDKKTGTAITIYFTPHWPDQPAVPGLQGDYFNNVDLTGTPALTRKDPVLNFTWDGVTRPAVEVNPTNFSARWTGFISIPTTGTYTFYITSDDGVRLWLDDVTGTPAVNQWVNRAPTENPTGSYQFTAGQRVPVKIEYYQGALGAALQLRWTGPGIAKSIIPAVSLQSPDAAVEEVPGLQTAETLVKSKFGLPSLQGASSVKILYQQSYAKAATKSAKLHDPTRRKVYLLTQGGLNAIPSSISTSSTNGRVYFQNLPAHLQQRFYLDPLLGSTTPKLGGLVLEGQFKDEVVGEDYLLPNILSTDDLAAIQGLASTSDGKRTAWNTAILGLVTTLETFKEDPNKPGTYIPDAAKNLNFLQDQLVEMTNDEQAVDSYALTGVGGGTGYVTLILGNGKAFTNPAEPVQMQILKVVPELYTGQVKPLTPANPLSETITMQHTGDFAGSVQDYDFEWYYAPALAGQPPIASDRPGNGVNSWFQVKTPAGANVNEPRATLGGSQPLLALTDNYYIMRYHRTSDTTGAEVWSAWTTPALAEGWIKRVLAGINPFNQRLGDFYNNTVNTDVSLLSQAGGRWEGDIPLTLKAAQDAGLIEIYETVLRRGINFTIEGTPAFDYGPANDALLLAAGYLNDLYMALGNEAYADAANPLISLDVDPSRLLAAQGLPASIGTTIQNTATARFAFEGQVASLLDEELALLRGRDDFLVPGVVTSPVYNRFFWNYTRGINAGEVIYALNYNITEKAGTGADGKIDATDAARQYPQGHGDAYGHYLTAMTNYYRLLSDPNFTWTPRVEAVNILGVPVTVDYQDERKLALAAVSLGRTASRVIDLERRKLPIGTDSGWATLRENKANSSTQKSRTWGVEQWATRSGQGNFVHWAVVNALLPENDNAHEGIQKIDRQSVPELDELASLGSEIQSHMDGANRHANALNLSDDSVLFDLSPSQMAAGSSHFDQILARAKAALENASTAFARTADQNALLRTVENQAADYNFTVTEQETAFNNQLIEIFGRPYAGDIGVGKTYPQDYEGPDYLRFMYVDRPYIYSSKLLFGDISNVLTFTLPIKQSSYSAAILKYNGSTAGAGSLNKIYTGLQTSTDPTVNFTYALDMNAGPYQIASASAGARSSTGQVQNALLAVMNAREKLYGQLSSLDGARGSFAKKVKQLQDDVTAKNTISTANTAFNATKLAVDKSVAVGDLLYEIVNNTKSTNQELADAVEKAFPTTVGPFAVDAFAPARGAILAAKVLSNTVLSNTKIANKIFTLALGVSKDVAELAKNNNNEKLQLGIDTRAKIVELQSAYSAVFAGIDGLDAANKELTNALNNYQTVLSKGLAIQDERETFRKRAASAIQGARTRDVAFRAFRTESLEQYKTLYDQAAQYVFLAAKAYDYETGLLGTDNGRSFLSGIVATRSLGLVGSNGEPQFGGSGSGDPGLSSYLAKLQADWAVTKGRLGINNPDQYGTLLSLRRELFNLPYREDGTAEDNNAWQDRLRASAVTDLRTDPDVAAHALPTSNPTGLSQPGFIITFSGDIDTGYNFFGNALNAGDSAFSSASFSTKINSVGVVFQGYLGMNPYAAGGTGIPPAPTSSSSDALSATPYCYLIPAGTDSMRTPALNGAPVSVRQWLVLDHAMPLPYDIGGSGFGQDTTWNSSTSLSEPFFLPRMHQPFRAVADPTLFYSSIPAEFTNRRLIGRSVWNTKWKLVIPAQTLLANPQDGMDRFIRSVKDIKLFLRTYSNAGN